MTHPTPATWIHVTIVLLFAVGLASAQSMNRGNRPPVGWDTDQDGLADFADDCPRLSYDPGFDGSTCNPMDLNPGNDPLAECRARERVAKFMLEDPAFITHIAFSVVKDGQLHFADAFRYLGGGQFAPDPDGVTRLFRIGSTSKAVVAVTAKILEERGELSLDDFVNDSDASRIPQNGQRRLRHLLSHQGAFKVDAGAAHLFCYPGDLQQFWLEPDDLVSPHYTSPTYGNLGGGFEYSAFNYSLAGAYLTTQTGESFEQVIQTRLFDVTGMCTATVDGHRARHSPIGRDWAVAQDGAMHIGPWINLISPTDSLCEDNYYSSEAVYGDPYDWLFYRLDEASAKPRDPPGGVIASVLDMGHFASALLESYHGSNGILSPTGIRELWSATHDYGCAGSCTFQPYYGIGFFTSAQAGQPVVECEHGGVRSGYTSAFVLRPEANRAVSVLVNANASATGLSDLAKQILDDFGP